MKRKTAAVVLAAGQGSRMKSDVHKQYLLLKGRPVVYYSLKVFEDSFVDEIVLVTGAGEASYCRKEIVEKYGLRKVSRIVEGGRERYHSVFCGLQALDDCGYVFIHDGARPFITGEILERAYEAVQKENACVVGMPVKDTIKLVDEDRYADSTPRRDRMWLIQTPQVFSFDLVRGAYASFLEKEEMFLEQGMKVTDDAMLVEQFTNTRIKLVEGSYENIKITTSEDMIVAEAFLK